MLKIEKMYGCAMLVGSVTFFSFGGMSVHVGIRHPKSTKCAFICSIHVSVTYVKVPLTWTLEHVLLKNIQTWVCLKIGYTPNEIAI